MATVAGAINPRRLREAMPMPPALGGLTSLRQLYASHNQIPLLSFPGITSSEDTISPISRHSCAPPDVSSACRNLSCIHARGNTQALSVACPAVGAAGSRWSELELRTEREWHAGSIGGPAHLSRRVTSGGPRMASTLWSDVCARPLGAVSVALLPS